MRLDRPGEAVALERQADRDQHLLDLLVGDAEDDRSPVGEGHDEAFVLELAERLANRAAARPELRRERRLDQAVAGLEAAGDDRRPQDLDHLLAPRAGLRSRVGDSRPARPAVAGRTAVGWSCRQSQNG